MKDYPTGNRKSSPPATIGNVLIVDDSNINLRLLSQLLTSRGHHVQMAQNGNEALKVAQSSPTDLILLDIMMPEMDGYQVCQRLKADEQTNAIPVIFISALDATQDKVKALNIGGVDYITKPFQGDEVIARVETHLSLRALQKQFQVANRELAHQLEELQARNEELDAFAQAIAQDLKTPLTSIIGFADMLENLQATLPPEAMKDSLHAIASNGRKMNKIIDDLLLLAKVRQTQHVDIVPLDMGSVVATALKRLTETIKEHKADIVLPASWPAALGYKPWVEEVWVNAISNAILQGGSPPRVELGATPEADGLICFWVRDNGAAAAAAGETTRAKGGGLGQFIVQRIMKQLGRQTETELAGKPEQPGKEEGNQFTFTLSAVK